jgi:ComEC/Rec2-related protein
MEESCLVGGFDVLVYLQASPPKCGDCLNFRAQVQKFPLPRNPGQFDAASFYRREGLWVQAIVPRGVSLNVLQRESGLTFAEGVERLRSSLSEHLRIGLEARGQTHALLSSMVLGIHSDSLLEARDSFVKTGTLHLFAVSGLNMTMLATMLIVVLRAFGASGVLADLAVFCIVIVYAVATGLGPSSLRAVVMGAIVMVAGWISRPASLLNSLGAAALGCLLFDTNVLFRAGFQLSFGLVFGLSVIGRRLGAVLSRVFNPDSLVPRALWKDWQWRRIKYWRPCSFALAASVSTWVSILPWSVFFLHQLTPVSLLVNLVVIPIAFLNLALGFTSLLCAPLLRFEQFLGMPVGFSRSLVASINSSNGCITCFEWSKVRVQCRVAISGCTILS